MRNFFRILRFGAPYRSYAFLTAFFNLLATVFHLASLLLFIPFLRLLLGQVEPVDVRPTQLWTREGLEPSHRPKRPWCCASRQRS